MLEDTTLDTIADTDALTDATDATCIADVLRGVASPEARNTCRDFALFLEKWYIHTCSHFIHFTSLPIDSTYIFTPYFT